MNYNFEEDLAIAQKTEAEVAQLIMKLNQNITKVKYCKNGDYDLLLIYKNGHTKTVEIKEDFYCQRSGNVALEYECRGKLSGISTTKANIIMYKVHMNNIVCFHACTASKLKESIRNRRYFRDVVGGDVGSNTKMLLYKYPIFQEICDKFHEYVK